VKKKDFGVRVQDVNDPCNRGSFFEGDSYIILHTKRTRSGALTRDIFFWLGAESSQDEKGVAAVKTVELDEYFKGEPTQYRETQGHESKAFKALFKEGVSYRPGGIAGGFRSTSKKDEHEKRLLHVKGRRNIRVTQVECKAASVNKGDCFILDDFDDIYQWNGPKASRLERQKAMTAARKIRDEERGGRSQIHIFDVREKFGDDDTDFWKALGEPRPDELPEGTDDADAEKKAKGTIKLFHLSDEGGSLVQTELTERPLKKQMLNPKDAYILDTGPNGIFGWVGKRASPQERSSAMKNAMKFAKDNNYPNWTPIQRIAQGAETPQFKECFQMWDDPRLTRNVITGSGSTMRPAFRKKTFDATTMVAQREKEGVALPDDGTGKTTVWRIEKREMVKVPTELHGQFFSGDSYVILYEYKDKRGKDAAFIYFWQGLKSSQDEKADAALRAVELDDQMGGMPVQCRVVQNKEPPHFYLIFKGKFVVHQGGIGSGFKNRNEEDSYNLSGKRLFHVKASNEFNIRAIEVPAKGANLNSGDCFILEDNGTLYLWFGNGCSREERDYTKGIFRKIWSIKINGKPVVVMEGKEPAPFWKALDCDGPAKYSNFATVKDPKIVPRLFQCSNDKGYFYAEECVDFDQEDLIEEDVMLLDAFTEIFIWIGKGANLEEKEKSMSLAKTYVQEGAEQTGRKEDDVSFMVINQGHEPPNFTCHFHAWDDEKWRGGQTYLELKAAAMNVDVMSLEDATSKFTVGGTKYPYDKLKARDIPEEVDLTRLEAYLSDEEFESVFKTSRADFEALATWKQQSAKKKVKLL